MGNESNLEKMVSFSHLRSYFEGKHVFLTGHTGFKGSWLLQILSLMGAKVYGYSLTPEKKDDLYYRIDGDALCEKSILADIRDVDRLQQELLECQPDYIFHLAAQPLVLRAYQEPLYTFDVNGQGTANVLEALRKLSKKCVAVMITTDKVYENLEEERSFKEDDKLGGYDPYSASKAVAEIIISSYRNSFFNPARYSEHQKSIASMRAGNVIGGGDYSDNRIIPDIIRALEQNVPIELRFPNAIRPWQHVLEPLGAYLLLATKMLDQPTEFCSSYNIGPEATDILKVETLAQMALEIAGKGEIKLSEEPQKLHEAGILMLDIHKIKQDLHWLPKMNAQQAIRKTIEWYLDADDASNKCIQQINEYFESALLDAIPNEA